MGTLELSSFSSPIDYFGIWSFDMLGGTGAPKDADERPSDRTAVDAVFDQNKNLEVYRSLIRLSGTPVAKGGFGTIWRATLIQKSGPGLSIAVKKLLQVKTQRTRLAREIKIWAELRHPNILPLIGYYWDEPTAEAWLISPFCEDGNVKTYLSTGRQTMEQRLNLLMDTANGLEYLHQQVIPVCHGDLKAGNVLVNPHRRAMLCDFGLARLLRDRALAGPTGLTTSESQKGSAQYYSPELAHPKPSDRPLPTLQSDVWAWGCLALEITTGKTPFSRYTTLPAIAIALSRLEIPEDLSKLDLPQSLKGILEACWQSDPASRPTISECRLMLDKATELLVPEGRPKVPHDDGQLRPSVSSSPQQPAPSPPPRHPQSINIEPEVRQRTARCC